jgi:hypothetical protein
MLAYDSNLVSALARRAETARAVLSRHQRLAAAASWTRERCAHSAPRKPGDPASQPCRLSLFRWETNSVTPGHEQCTSTSWS